MLTSATCSRGMPRRAPNGGWASWSARKSALVEGWEAVLKELERGNAVRLQPGAVHAVAVIGALGVEAVELAAQLGELESLQFDP